MRVITVGTGLNNPRGLAFGPEGALYVAEAGSGGAGPCVPGPVGGPVCYGASSSITRIDLRKETQERVATGLPSLAGEGGVAAIGAHDISFQGRGGAYVTVGLGADPAARSLLGAVGANFDQLARLLPNGAFANLADLGAWETGENPAGDEIDSNPYGVLALPGKHIVADAGENDLIEVSANGTPSTLATFPNRLVPAPPFLGLPPGTLIPWTPCPPQSRLGLMAITTWAS